MNTHNDRLLQMLCLLHENAPMKVTELAELLGVSLVTVRKDLTKLEEKKLLLRCQGYVKLNTSTHVNRRMISNYAQKIRIAKKAADLVSDGDTVIIESGSCCILLADELKHSGKKVTILTNSTFIADFITPYQNIKIILMGGEYQPDSMAVVGPVTRACLEPFHARFFFSGTDGYRAGSAFTGDNPERAEILSLMSKHALQTVVITESQKFQLKGTLTTFSLEDTEIVITDNEIEKDVLKELESHNITVFTV